MERHPGGDEAKGKRWAQHILDARNAKGNKYDEHKPF
jgi:hypothetical protein